MCQNDFNRDFSIVKYHEWEVTFFPVKILNSLKSLNILSKMLDIYIKFHIFKLLNHSNILTRTQVYDLGLSPIPMQNPYTKLLFGLNFLFVIQFSKFLLHIL